MFSRSTTKLLQKIPVIRTHSRLVNLTALHSFSTYPLQDYTYFERYFKKFCDRNQMDIIDYSVLSKHEELIVPIVWAILRREAEEVANREKLMKPLIDEAILQHHSFKDALSYRLATKLGGHLIPADQWLKIFQEAYSVKQTDFQYDLENAACLDLVAVKDRDPACDKLFTAFMFFKGYKALQIYRVSHVLWQVGRKELASLMQSRSSEVFSVDIHPAAKIGRGLMIDHATGLVIGETAVVGEHCSFLHGVTLGGTGKEGGDRHPKIGDHVAIGCNASIIGNIRIGNHAKIGSSSVVVKPVPDYCTAVGTPARIIYPKSVEGNTSNNVETLSATIPVATPIEVTKTNPSEDTMKSTTDNVSSSVVQQTTVSPLQPPEDVVPLSLPRVHYSSQELVNIVKLIDVANLPESIILLLMPLFLIYSFMSTTGCA